MYNRFHRLVDDLIDVSNCLRSEIPLAVMSLPASTFVLEHATIQVDCGRRAGKTSYICERAKKGDLVITYSGPSAQQFGLGREFKVMVPETVMRLKDGLDPDTDRPFERIFVDEPRFVFKEIARNAFYDKLIKNHDQVVIILGS